LSLKLAKNILVLDAGVLKFDTVIPSFSTTLVMVNRAIADEDATGTSSIADYYDNAVG
jgi:hypothetical protein